MFKPQIRIRSKRQFGPQSMEDSTANDGIQLSYGLGWGVLQSPHGPGAFKEGHGDGFEHYSILFPEHGTGVMLLANSANGESAFRVYGMGGNVWEWTSTAVAGKSGESLLEFRILKGGSFMTSAKALRCANRLPEDPRLFHPDVGFRCARDAK